MSSPSTRPAINSHAVKQNTHKVCIYAVLCKRFLKRCYTVFTQNVFVNVYICWTVVYSVACLFCDPVIAGMSTLSILNVTLDKLLGWIHLTSQITEHDRLISAINKNMYCMCKVLYARIGMHIRDI